ncbi:MAG: hypothetical protein ACXW4B_10475 [Micavibrio sp.]
MRLLAVILLSFYLVSCGGSTAPSATNTTATDPGSGTQQTIAPLSVPAPPDSSDRPLQAGQSGTTYMPNGLPALQARGLNPEMLFAEKLKDEDARFARLENAVVDMRKEFESVKPAIIRLAAVEEDMQILLQQLEMLVQGGPPVMDAPPPVPVEETALPPQQQATVSPQPLTPSPPAAAEPEPEPVIESPVAEAPVVAPPAAEPPLSATGPTVKNVRVGEHSGTTRLVFDMNGKTKFTHDLDNTEKLLLIELPEAGWTAPRQWSSADAPLIESWSVQAMEGGKGSRLIIRLRRAVTIATATALTDPDRIMFDLKAN